MDHVYKIANTNFQQFRQSAGRRPRRRTGDVELFSVFFSLANFSKARTIHPTIWSLVLDIYSPERCNLVHEKVQAGT